MEAPDDAEAIKAGFKLQSDVVKQDGVDGRQSCNVKLRGNLLNHNELNTGSFIVFPGQMGTTLEWMCGVSTYSIHCRVVRTDIDRHECLNRLRGSILDYV